MKPKPPGGAASPAVASPLLPGGGPVQTAAAVYVVFWGWTSDPSGEQTYLTNFLSTVGGTTWANTMRQYGAAAPAGLLKGTWSDSSVIPAGPTDDQISAEALVAAQHFGLAQSINTQIVVATPTGHSSPGFAAYGGNWCAYHGYARSATYSALPYTNLPYMTDAGGSCGQGSVNGSAGLLDGVSIVEGHELAETVTDPLVNAWRDSTGDENGDKCAWNPNDGNITTSAGTFAMQPLWSDLTSDCPLTTTVTISAPTTPTATAVIQPGNGNVTISAQTNLNGGAGLAWVDYGTSSSYGSSASFQVLPSGTATSVSFPLTGLAPGPVHYRANVSNYAGATASIDGSFVVAGAPRINAFTAGALSGSGNEWTLGNATLFTDSSATESVQYGTTSAYGSSITPQTVTGSLQSDGTYNAVIGQQIHGLAAGVIYHYSITITTAHGTTSSADQTFGTAGPPLIGSFTAGALSGSGNEWTLGNATLFTDTTATESVQYGTTSAYGSSITPQTVTGSLQSDGTYNAVIGQQIHGLTTGVTYHYSITITTAHGTTASADQTFVAAGPPRINAFTAGALSGSGNEWTLGNALFTDTTATESVNYGTTSAYGSSIAAQTVTGSLQSDGTYNAVIGQQIHGLTTGVTYHYSITITTAHGTTASVDQTFVAQ